MTSTMKIPSRRHFLAGLGLGLGAVSVEDLNIQVERGAAVDASAAALLHDLADKLRSNNDALAEAIGSQPSPVIEALAQSCAEAGRLCAYCGRRGPLDTSCVGCGAYLAAPRLTP